MANSEINYILHCKLLIEERLCWIDTNNWKQRDYLNLIGLIETKTGVCLSLSTLKRIWKPDFSGIPHPSTLDAFAQFLDYDNWLAFKKHNEPFISEHQSTIKKRRPLFIKSKLFFGIIGLALASILAITIFQSNNKPLSTSGVFYNPINIKFECNTTVAKGVPNTVVFSYNITKAVADSFFIQQSWDRFRRDKIEKYNSKLTSTYMYPGYHKAKLIANDSIIKEVGVRVNTNGWLALTRYSYNDLSPTYIKNSDVRADGKLHISKKHLAINNVELNKSLMASYFLIDNFKNLSSSNFIFETRVKCDSLININCPNIGIIITGEGQMNYIPLLTKGCSGEAFLKLGDLILSGKNNDLSGFGCDIYNWQSLKIEVINKHAKIYLNDKLIIENSFKIDIDEITGCNINFTGSGSLDFVRYSNINNELVYQEEFD